MTTSNKTKIFIDGQHGTTGLQIHDRLKDRPDIELLELPMADRKDLGKRAEIAKSADIAVLCLPDAAAKELVAALGDADTCVIDASTAHRVADGWIYGFPELDKAQRAKLLGLQAHQQSRLLSDGRHRHPAAAGRCRHRARRRDARRVRRLGLHRRRQGADRGARERPRRRAVRPLRRRAHAQARAGDEEVLQPQHAPLFVPSVGHYAQGMLVMVPITRDIVAKKVTAADVHKVLADYYAGETFVPVRPLSDRKWLERDRFLRADRLIDTNSMELAVYGNEAEQQILAVASLDNLGKGASGAAVQVINLKTGVDETTGLAVAA